MQLLLGHWPMDKPVRLLSVTAANLLPENQSCEQLSLFDAAEDIQKRDRQHKLDQTVDALRQKFGDQSVVFAHSVKKKRIKQIKHEDISIGYVLMLRYCVSRKETAHLPSIRLLAV